MEIIEVFFLTWGRFLLDGLSDRWIFSFFLDTPSVAPGPLPLGVSVVDQSIIVFGVIFPRAAQKHRLQMLEHFSEHLKQHQGNKRSSGSSVAAAEAIQMNIFTAVLSSLKGLVEAKAKFGQEDVKKAAINLILGELIF